MTHTETAALVGREVTLTVEGFTLTCRIVDAKTSYGTERYMVEGFQVTGCQWVNASRVKEVGK